MERSELLNQLPRELLARITDIEVRSREEVEVVLVPDQDNVRDDYQRTGLAAIVILGEDKLYVRQDFHDRYVVDLSFLEGCQPKPKRIWMKGNLEHETFRILVSSGKQPPRKHAIELDGGKDLIGVAFKIGYEYCDIFFTGRKPIVTDLVPVYRS